MNGNGRRTRRLFRLIHRSRPRFWLYLAGPVLVGLAFGADSPTDLVSAPAIALVTYFLVPANSFLYGVNDIFDASVDARNPKKDGRELRYEGDRSVWWTITVSGLLGVALALWIPAAARWILGFLVLGWTYSAPPRLKTTPPLDSLSNGLYVLPGAAAYAAVGGSPPLLAVFGGWLWAMGMHTYSAIPDVTPDRKAGIRTTATVLGEQDALVYCTVCWLFAAGVFATLDGRLGLLLATYPILLVGIVFSGLSVERAYWWFPAVNTVVGAALTIAGLWRLVHG